MFYRSAGILMPVSSLAGSDGIGTFGKEAFEFVDFLKKAGQRYWQILPMGPTGYGDSPYQSFSTFAGSPYYIDLQSLKDAGLLSDEELGEYKLGEYKNKVDYGMLYEHKIEVLRKAFLNIDEEMFDEVLKFADKNEWVNDYALYMAIKSKNGMKAWQDWPLMLKQRDEYTLQQLSLEYADEIAFYIFTQYCFETQWQKVKKYANDNGIKIIGDMPMYVATDSSDTWANTEIFETDENYAPKRVAGCPPDFFSADGQMWGNMLYNWDYLKSTGYDWWIKRMKQAFSRYDVVRIDHFRAFDTYWAIPYGDKTAANGEWENGPGRDFFDVLNRECPDCDIIAEDLGQLFDSVRDLLKYTGYPGMKILQFAFSPDERSSYLPHNHIENCVVYTGTHDNDTTSGWIEKMGERERDFVKKYLSNDNFDTWDIIACAYRSNARLAIVPMHDFLELGTYARINEPSTGEGNWSWRMNEGVFTDLLASKIADYVSVFGR